jgi:transcriptional regulator with XRE-family HTH domain
MTLALIINERIKVIREHKGLTASDLARMTGLNQSEISQIESGRKRSPRLDTIQRIARAMDVTIDFLSGGREYPCSLANALALEALDLYLRDSAVHDVQTGALRAVAESATAPQSIMGWNHFINNLRVYESHAGSVLR